MDFLTDEVRLHLRKRLRSERDKRYAYRINVILLLDAGWTYQQIADALFLDDSTVRGYERQYRTQGIDVLLSDLHGGGNAKLTKAQEQELDAHLQEHLYATAGSRRERKSSCAATPDGSGSTSTERSIPAITT